ncbi:hypothetical protein ScPMuIL_003062 [Solemya velum]
MTKWSYDTNGTPGLDSVHAHALVCVTFSVYILAQVLRRQVRVTGLVVTKFFMIHVMNLAMLKLEAGVWGLVFMTCTLLYFYETLPVRYLPVQEKVVLITGCDRGIGHNLAKQLDQLGFYVYAGCLQKGSEGEQELVRNCSSRLTTLQLDVCQLEQVENAVNKVTNELGNKELWGIVNNAGICFVGNVETMTTADIQKLITVNYLGPVNICKAFFPLLRKGKGRLVNISSNAGLAPVPEMGVYCASKAALATMTEVWRYELQKWGIKVATIIPSGYKTGILAYDKQATAERWWRSASDAVKEDYGKECFYAKPKTEALLSPDLSPILDALVDALLSKSPKAYYYRGIFSRALPFLYLHLPTTLGDLVMKVIGDWFISKPLALQKSSKKF